MEQRWPARLWIVRHGQSAGNVARDAADAAGMTHIDIADRDMDVPLSALGRQQAQALGRWFADQPAEERPCTLMASPYLRAVQTSQEIRDAGGLVTPNRKFCVDERLREKEFGVLDRLTRRGIEAQFPEQAEFRRLLGKFYHRPPGGESWCDVILRLRSLLDTLSLHHGADRVLIVAHQVVVLCLRYLLEGLTEQQILEIDGQADIANCGVTQYRFDPGSGPDGELVLERYNFTAPLEREDAPVTAAPDANVAAR
ncbi:histidine phosphatase family protein [Caulobacter hibisci]|uniref:Histidine phosphatase family protein n=1 Tax=Caulobacter hibisci TaxID=2035993 RepID=A0ABS0SXA0_9CAUL|nr:histidine phosphatase family protein [Caulobacter hibisci]MBI1684267.1 histidine phosphatase family protein [Caulobacter hibisci]